ERNSDGQWRFTSETIDSLNDMVGAVRDQQIVTGVEFSPELSIGMRIRDLVPPYLQRVGVILEHWQWLAILALITAGLLIDRLVAFLLAVVSGPALRRFSYSLDWNRRKTAARPFGLLAMAGLWAVGINWLLLPSTVLGV